jgi:hypothetical protein
VVDEVGFGSSDAFGYCTTVCAFPKVRLLVGMVIVVGTGHWAVSSLEAGRVVQQGIFSEFLLFS